MRDSVRSCVFSGGLEDEVWHAPPADEKDAWIQEELYIHSKLLIVDDRRVLIGSANINERSQNGDRDSEIAIVIEDDETVACTMAGQPYSAARFAASFRRFLQRQHLGLIEPQDGYGPVTDAMRMIGTPQVYDWDSENDKLVADPLSPKLDDMIRYRAKTNEEVFERVFRCVPSNQVTDWPSYEAYLPKPPTRIGHVPHDLKLSPQEIKAELAKIRGALVPCPHDFLKEVQMTTLSAEVNAVTLSIYL